MTSHGWSSRSLKPKMLKTERDGKVANHICYVHQGQMNWTNANSPNTFGRSDAKLKNQNLYCGRSQRSTQPGGQDLATSFPIQKWWHGIASASRGEIVRPSTRPAQGIKDLKRQEVIGWANFTCTLSLFMFFSLLFHERHMHYTILGCRLSSCHCRSNCNHNHCSNNGHAP